MRIGMAITLAVAAGAVYRFAENYFMLLDKLSDLSL